MCSKTNAGKIIYGTFGTQYQKPPSTRFLAFFSHFTLYQTTQYFSKIHPNHPDLTKNHKMCILTGDLGKISASNFL